MQSSTLLGLNIQTLWLLSLVPSFVALVFWFLPTSKQESKEKHATLSVEKWGAYLTAAGSLAFSLLGSWLCWHIPPDAASLEIQWLSIAGRDISFGLTLDEGHGRALLPFVWYISAAVQGFGLVYVHEKPLRFQLYVAVFALAMSHLVLSDNLLILFMAWEVMGLCSYLLIGHDHERRAAGLSALLAFLTNRVADVAFVALLGLAWAAYGTWHTEVLVSNPEHHWASTIGILAVVAAMGKSAQLGFQHWLRAAMEGPTPASALIHAATMVTAGIILLTRLSPLLLHDVALWVQVIGIGTALLAGYLALGQRDLKATLAYSTISQLGFMLAAIPGAQGQEVTAYLMSHGIAKATLFLAAGTLIYKAHHSWGHEAHLADGQEGEQVSNATDGTWAQDLSAHGRLWLNSPLLATAFLVAAASLIGLPGTAGFNSKDALLAAWLSEPSTIGFWLSLLVVILTAAYTTRLITLLLLPAVSGGQGEEKYPYHWALVGIPLALSTGAVVYSQHSSLLHYSPWSLTHTHFTGATALPIPLMALAAAAIGILLGLVLARQHKLIWATGGEIKWPLAYLDLNYRWVVQKIGAFVAGPIAHAEEQVEQHLHDDTDRIQRKTGMALSHFMQVLDQRIIDGLVNQISRLGVLVGHLVKGLETYVVDGVVKSVQLLSAAGGRRVSATAETHVQSYVLTAVLLILVLVGIWLL